MFHFCCFNCGHVGVYQLTLMMMAPPVYWHVVNVTLTSGANMLHFCCVCKPQSLKEWQLSSRTDDWWKHFFPSWQEHESQTTSTTSHTITSLHLLPSKVIRNNNTGNPNYTRLQAQEKVRSRTRHRLDHSRTTKYPEDRRMCSGKTRVGLYSNLMILIFMLFSYLASLLVAIDMVSFILLPLHDNNDFEIIHYLYP